MPFCAQRKVTEPAQLSNRVLNDLSVGLLDGTLSRSGRPLRKATVHSYMRAVNTFVAWANAEAGEAIPPRPSCPGWGAPSSRPVLDRL